MNTFPLLPNICFFLFISFSLHEHNNTDSLKMSLAITFCMYDFVDFTYRNKDILIFERERCILLNPNTNFQREYKDKGTFISEFFNIANNPPLYLKNSQPFERHKLSLSEGFDSTTLDCVHNFDGFGKMSGVNFCAALRLPLTFIAPLHLSFNIHRISSETKSKSHKMPFVEKNSRKQSSHQCETVLDQQENLRLCFRHKTKLLNTLVIMPDEMNDILKDSETKSESRKTSGLSK